MAASRAAWTAPGAREYNTTRKTVGKWVERFRTEGVNGLRDRSSKHHRTGRLNGP
jgi:transposase